MTIRFVDSNVIIAIVGEPHSDQGYRGRALLQRIETGEETGLIDPTVVLESAFVLTRRLQLPVRFAADALLEIIGLPNIGSRQKTQVLEALERWGGQPALSFPDWFHLVLARESAATEIYSFDRAMDRLPGVARVEP